MKNKNLITLSLLIFLSILVSILSYNHIYEYIIIVTFALKFILVAFNFMDMKNAHVFWKILIILFISILFSTIGIMKTNV